MTSQKAKMMTYQNSSFGTYLGRPKRIDLSEAEEILYKQAMRSADSHQEWEAVSDAMENLMYSLLDRQAIPEKRMHIFNKAEYAEKGSKSIRESFGATGKNLETLFRHGTFRRFFQYFIEGPDLPKSVIDGLCEIIKADRGTSGMLLDEYSAFARASIKRHQLEHSKAATEFFRLGVEIGMDLSDARALRDAAMKGRAKR